MYAVMNAIVTPRGGFEAAGKPIKISAGSENRAKVFDQLNQIIISEYYNFFIIPSDSQKLQLRIKSLFLFTISRLHRPNPKIYLGPFLSSVIRVNKILFYKLFCILRLQHNHPSKEMRTAPGANRLLIDAYMMTHFKNVPLINIGKSMKF